ncbi:hypothetical protein G6F70_007642 [Rhizopus microsporus]|uniref:Uncharacterized protein n=2 Tax=Rhizopus TaxID=4842 RepID=A0A367J473_RHIAZ|nr:hypothetical protein G6F71_009214 [Rhizopus microsporus]RCH84727.1 hypothetical protein CU097_007977 [Rhizopus azygosporus]KAG1196184.1 hypothetical protein G6F70_007642 [Rhizopus microsporus]KAG1214159.1 hypothetical protein G6F69_002192 [Rhizopus microsporus]KAG1225779.1 hypothetical protein G6F67_009209 [Rhizopus microsporus]
MLQEIAKSDEDYIELSDSEEAFFTAPSSPTLNASLPSVYDPVVLNALWEFLKQAHETGLFNQSQGVSAPAIKSNVVESDTPAVIDREVVVISSDDDNDDEGFIHLPSLTQDDLDRFPALHEAVYGLHKGRFPKCPKKNYVSFECYIDDPHGYDRLKTDPNKVYEPFTPEWYTIKRRVFFDSLGVERRGRCVECHSTGDDIGMNSKSHAVAIRRRKHPLCKFCTRLYSRPWTLNEEIEIIEYLMSGRLSPSEISRTIRKVERRVKNRKFLVPINRDAVFVPKGWCNLTKCPVYKHLGWGAYWMSTVDHILPKSKVPRGEKKNGINRSNLQNMCQLMNSIKSNDYEESIRAWWHMFKETKQEERRKLNATI